MSAATWACCCGWRVVVAGSRWASSLARTAQNRYRGARPHSAQLFLDALPTSDEASFDVVALSEVFEHVTEPRTFLATAARFLRPCGLLYLRVPNARWSILKQRHQYPSPWVLDWRRHLGRLGFYAAGKAERSLRRGEIGDCALNLVALPNPAV